MPRYDRLLVSFSPSRMVKKPRSSDVHCTIPRPRVSLIQSLGSFHIVCTHSQLSIRLPSDIRLTTALSLIRFPQLIRPTHRHPSLSTILTLLSHPPIATHRPPGAHVTVLIPIPGSSPAVSENEGEAGEKWVRQGPRGEWIYIEY